MSDKYERRERLWEPIDVESAYDGEAWFPDGIRIGRQRDGVINLHGSFSDHCNVKILTPENAILLRAQLGEALALNAQPMAVEARERYVPGDLGRAIHSISEEAGRVKAKADALDGLLDVIRHEKPRLRLRQTVNRLKNDPFSYPSDPCDWVAGELLERACDLLDAMEMAEKRRQPEIETLEAGQHRCEAQWQE